MAELYLANQISPEEYVEFLIASGYDHDSAWEALTSTHDDGAPDHWTRPAKPKPAIDWSTLGRPGRKPTKPPKVDNETTGHPLEEEGD